MAVRGSDDASAGASETQLVAASFVVFLGFGVLVLSVFFCVDDRNPQAAFGGQATKKSHHLPHLAVIESTFPGRHSRWTDAVLDDPLQLSILVVLHVFRGERRNWRGHLVSERYSSGLAIQPVADATVMAKVFFAVRDVRLGCGDWVGNVFAPDRDVVLHFIGHLTLGGTRFVDPAAEHE